MKRLLVLLILFPQLAAMAQSGGTVKSRFGIGELNHHTTTRQSGMGLVSVPLSSSYDVSKNNPASWSSVNGMRLQAEVSYSYIMFDESEVDQTAGEIEGFQFLFPLEESYKLRVVTGLLPVSRSEYYIRTRSQSDVGDEYLVNYRGDGGLSLFRLGASVQPWSFLQLGAVFQYYFGTIEQEQEILFDNGSFFNSMQRVATSHTGPGTLFGMTVFPIDGLVIGASLQSKSELNVSQYLRYSYITGDSVITGRSGQQDIPMEYRLGLSYQVSDRILLAADYSSQDWTDAIGFEGEQNTLTETYKIGAGVEYRPWKNNIAVPAKSQWMFRFGIFSRQTYIQLTDEAEKEYFITAGWGFPVFGTSYGDLAVEYGIRGDETQVLGAKNIIRLSFGISVGENWFVRSND